MEYLSLIIGSSGLVGILLILFYSGKWFGKMDLQFKEVMEEMKEIKSDIKEIRKDLNSLSERISRLEVRVEERTLKVVHVQKTFGEGKANEN